MSTETTKPPPPKILQEVAECLALDREIANRVKGKWDEDPLFRFTAILAANGRKIERCIRREWKESLRHIIHDIDDVLRKPQLFYAKLGIVIRSTK